MIFPRLKSDSVRDSSDMAETEGRNHPPKTTHSAGHLGPVYYDDGELVLVIPALARALS